MDAVWRLFLVLSEPLTQARKTSVLHPVWNYALFKRSRRTAAVVPDVISILVGFGPTPLVVGDSVQLRSACARKRTLMTNCRRRDGLEQLFRYSFIVVAMNLTIIVAFRNHLGARIFDFLRGGRYAVVCSLMDIAREKPSFRLLQSKYFSEGTFFADLNLLSN